MLDPRISTGTYQLSSVRRNVEKREAARLVKKLLCIRATVWRPSVRRGIGGRSMRSCRLFARVGPVPSAESGTKTVSRFSFCTYLWGIIQCGGWNAGQKTYPSAGHQLPLSRFRGPGYVQASVVLTYTGVVSHAPTHTHPVNNPNCLTFRI